MSKLKKAYTDKKHPRSHIFLFKIGGVIKPISTKVRGGKGSFEVWLDAETVRTAIIAKSFGDAQNCPGAICFKKYKDTIPHKFTGYADFWDYRLFLSERNSRRDNFPTHSVAWKHNRPEIAKLFDNKQTAMQLLRMLERDGPMKITVTEPVYQSGSDTSRKRGEADPLKRKFRVGHTARINRVDTGISDPEA